MFEAVVLAGGEATDPLALQEGVLNKSLIPVFGRPLVGYILTALAACPLVTKIIVVGPKEGLQALQNQGYVFTAVTGGGTMLGNIAAGLKEADPDRLCLLSTGDVPLIDSKMLEELFVKCAPYDADFYYPIITKESCRHKFPGTGRTCVRLQEGTFTGGNLALIRPSWFNRQQGRLETFIAYRKRPLQLLRILPLQFLVKFLFHRLSLNDLETYLSRLLDLVVRAVPCPYAEMATDVDKPSDLAVVTEVLGRQKNEGLSKRETAR
jgi:GTP:adenosylcobinamide-phosphate guanylyltransferase